MKKFLSIGFSVLMIEIFTFLLLEHAKTGPFNLCAEANQNPGFLPIPPILADMNPDPVVANCEFIAQKSKTSFYEDKYS